MKTEKYLKTEALLHSSGKFRIKLGLERISAILNILENPQEKIKVIHVAGTNGKGSVCTLISEILKASGYKTALYTSPHLFKYNERFKINGIDISDNEFFNYTFKIDELAKKNKIDLSEFEILTAAAYKYFHDNNVDFAVMETGLGGRFDAVNSIKKPLITAISSISIDHKDRLGDTIEKIAFEKAGIIKNEVPIFTNSNNSGLNIIKNMAKEKNAPLFIADKNIDISVEKGINYASFDGKNYQFNLWGLHQKQNLSLVLKITDYLRTKNVKITDKSIENALKTAFIPARFEYIKDKNILIDGAHNADAARVLRQNLDFYFPNQNFNWIYGTISTKEYDKVINSLFKNGDTVYFCDFDYPSAVQSDKIIQKLDKTKQITIQKYSKTENILNYFNKNSLTIITGSFYMIGNILPEKIIL